MGDVFAAALGILIRHTCGLGRLSVGKDSGTRWKESYKWRAAKS